MGDNKVTATVESTVPEGTLRNWLIFGSIALFSAIIFGLLYLFVIAPVVPEGGQGYSIGWFLFSFAAGLTMIVLPCTLPLAFVIVPLSMGKGLVRGIGMALAFGVGVATTLSIYGIVFALVGGVLIDTVGTDLEVIKNWVYFGAGIFALLFALSEIGLLKFRMPTYNGAAPAFIQKRQEVLKAFLLGLFLGNIGVGCPHPATPLILIEIASSGDVLYGWLMFLVHAIGRVLPLLLLAFLAILGVNGLSWLMARKEGVERATGWAMVFVAGFILTLGLFSHDWWVNSGLHSGLETITQEARFNTLINDTLGTAVAHLHGLEEGEGLFGLPLEWGNWFLVIVWLVPIWWWYIRRRSRLKQSPDPCEDKILNTKRNFLIVISIFLILTFVHFLPQNFYLKSIGGAGHDDSGSEEHAHEEGVADDHAHMNEQNLDDAHTMADGRMMGPNMMDSLGTPFPSTINGLPEALPTQTIELEDGDTFDITAYYVQKEIGNRALRMLAYNGSVPGPFIKVAQGSEITINFTNNTDLNQTIHSHGLRIDNNSDGVPGVTQDAIPPGGSFVYTVKFEDGGVYWYHPHTRDDYGQEFGLYGNYLVEPASGYSSLVNREMPLVIDDILIENDRITDFYKDITNFALLGRFGNEYLVNGEKNYTFTAKKGEVLRFFITNVSNARTYNLSLPGVEMKLVGADVGQFEREFFAENFLISPAERLIVEAYFEKPGSYSLTHTMPDGSVELARILVTDESVSTSYAEGFKALQTNTEVVDAFVEYRGFIASDADKKLLLTVELTEELDHDVHAHDEASDNAADDQLSGIQWDDPMHSDRSNTSETVIWKIVDEDTGKVSMDIPVSDWTFKQGDLVKIRLSNDGAADHVMQHPIHFHGQRFVVLSTNGVPNNNLVWKDTVLVPPGEVVDILVEMSNLGEWMNHCHISEHLHAGMMMQFRVEDENGYATGDEYRSSLPADMQHAQKTVDTTTGEIVSSGRFTFNTPIPQSQLSITPNPTNFQINKNKEITISIFDQSGNSIPAASSHVRPVAVTFIKSDDSHQVYTYPGNTALEPLAPPHGETGHDNSDGHHNEPADDGHDNSDGHHGLRGIPVAYAHGDVADGHEDTEGQIYSYTMPVLFPEKGFYRAFVEFVPEGSSNPTLLSFNVEVIGGFSVDNFGWSNEMKWWILLLSSLVLMMLLSLVVYRYVVVKE